MKDKIGTGMLSMTGIKSDLLIKAGSLNNEMQEIRNNPGNGSWGKK